MSLMQFARSISLVRRAEHIGRPQALLRHLYFQGRKLFFPRALTLRLSQSVISDNEAGGVISMVNMLGMYDYNNMNLVRSALRGGGLMIDVGANIGSYTLVASEQPNARVIALEPNPHAYAKLMNNLALNRRTNVETLRLGASSCAGTVAMTDLPKTVLNRIVTGADPGATIPIEVTTLDQLCEARGLWPRVVKLDVEGHEPAVLAGATACLATADLVLIESADTPDVLAIMRAAGFQGPFYYRHTSRSMSPAPQRLPEDGVFIGPGFRSLLPDITVPRRDTGLGSVVTQPGLHTKTPA